MIISIIVAMDEQRGIGVNNRLPWHLSADLKRFKSLTMGHHILMGRKTYESIGRALPGRVMIVITHQQDFHPQGCLVVPSLQEGLTLAESRGESEMFIIGGGDIFAQSLDYVDKIYLTQVHTVAYCDVFFPEFDQRVWQESVVANHPPDGQNDFPNTFKILERIN